MTELQAVAKLRELLKRVDEESLSHAGDQQRQLDLSDVRQALAWAVSALVGHIGGVRVGGDN